MLEACERLGLDTGPILEAAKLDRAKLQDPDARIPVEQSRVLRQKAYEVSGDPTRASRHRSAALRRVSRHRFPGRVGGQNSGTNSGMAGMDVKIGLLRQGPDMPVSVSVPPELLVAHRRVRFLERDDERRPVGGQGVRRAHGLRRRRSDQLTRGGTARRHRFRKHVRRRHGQLRRCVVYTWRSLIAAAEIEHGTKARYAFRIGTRF